jgi:ketosteroid isomerase-like protein
MLGLVFFDLESVRKFDREFEEVFYRGDYAAMASMYTPDAKLMAEDMELIVGRQAIENFWKSTIARAKSINIRRTIHSEEIVSSEALGYVRGTVKLEIPSPSASQTMVQGIKYVTVWKRGENGEWRIAIDVSNRDGPLQSSRPAYGVGP